jgi:hypothetical protein
LKRLCDGHGLARVLCECDSRAHRALWRPVPSCLLPGLSVFRQNRRPDDSSKCVVRPRKAAATGHVREASPNSATATGLLGLKPSANLHRLYLISPTRSNCYPGSRVVVEYKKDRGLMSTRAEPPFRLNEEKRVVDDFCCWEHATLSYWKKNSLPHLFGWRKPQQMESRVRDVILISCQRY